MRGLRSSRSLRVERLRTGPGILEPLSWLSVRRFVPAQEVARGSLLRRAVNVRLLLVVVKSLPERLQTRAAVEIVAGHSGRLRLRGLSLQGAGMADGGRS